jgi:hypothetical protein
MKKFSLILIFCLCGFSQLVKSQSCAPIVAADLRRMLVELGYEVKDLSVIVDKEKFEIKILTPSFNVPMGVEISGSKNNIWFTVTLGKAFEENSPKNFALLKRNAVIQPSQFYITEKGNLMMAVALENKCVTNAALKKISDMLANKVSENKLYWQQN